MHMQFRSQKSLTSIFEKVQMTKKEKKKYNKKKLAMKTATNCVKNVKTTVWLVCNLSVKLE